MEWYLPFTMVPGIGLLVLSTSNILLNINAEITKIDKSKIPNKAEIIKLKLSQLRILGYAIMLEYLGLFLFVITSLATSLDRNHIAKITLFIGVMIIGVALAFLIVYSFRAISIRHKHLNHE